MRESNPAWQDTYKALARALWLGAGIFVLFWFIDAAMGALVFALLIMVLAIALNAPVGYLMSKGLPRTLALVAVLACLAGVLTVLTWLIVPRMLDQAVSLWEKLPEYARGGKTRLAEWLSQSPVLRDRTMALDENLVDSLTPILQGFATRLGGYTVSVLGAMVGAVLLVTGVVYAVAAPEPLVRGILGVFPAPMRGQASRALAKGSQTVVGWVWSNAIIGAVEAVAAGIFLTWIGVPGALVWATFTFFAELVPRVGSMVMAIPPMLVALAIDPMKAVWVLVFYVVIQWVVGDLLGPFVRAKQMNLHAVTIILATVAMGSAFGLMGVLLATPVAGFIKAFYDEFSNRASDPAAQDEALVDAVLARQDA